MRLENPLTGLEALKAMIAPFRGKIRIERAEVINRKVQHEGDLAVLTFNVISHGAQFDNGPKMDARWNSTEVYRRIGGRWRIVHSHWSYVKPAISKAP